MTEREKELIATKRDIKILYIKLKITQLESRISQLESNTKLEIEKLRMESNERITQLENNTRLEIEKIRAEIAKSESRIIKFILASSIIQTIFIISAVLTIIFMVVNKH